MLLMHLGDLHFGKTVNGFSMIEDQRYIMEEVIEMAKRRRPDVILLAGDIYDSKVPSTQAVELFDEFLTSLSQAGFPICIISGNHDSAQRLNFGNRLFASKKIYFSCTKESALSPIRLKDAYGGVNLWLLPFMGNADLEETIQEMQIDDKERNVCLAHCFVLQGSQSPELSDSETLLSAGGLNGVDVSAFDAFDYVALGHLHMPQSMGRKEVRYCGSWLKYSASETGLSKSVPFVELKGKGQVEISLEPLIPLRDMRKIKGKLSTLVSDQVASLADTKDYIYVTLTDETAQLNPMETLRSVYPHVMQISFENQQGGRVNAEQLSVEDLKHKSDADLFADFYEYVENRPYTEQKRKIMEDVIDEAAKTDR